MGADQRGGAAEICRVDEFLQSIVLGFAALSDGC